MPLVIDTWGAEFFELEPFILPLTTASSSMTKPVMILTLPPPRIASIERDEKYNRF